MRGRQTIQNEHWLELINLVWLALSDGSPLSVLREYVVAVLHYRVASEPAFGVVFLRRLGGCGRRLKRIGRRVIVERAPSPSAAISEPLAVLHHEINVMLRTWHGWLTGVASCFFGVQ